MPEQIISASGTQFGLIVESDGSINANINISGTFGSTERYIPIATDVTDIGSRYYGFEAADGNWYMQVSFASGGNNRTQLFRYLAGSTDFDTNWDNKTTSEFSNPGSIF